MYFTFIHSKLTKRHSMRTKTSLALAARSKLPSIRRQGKTLRENSSRSWLKNGGRLAVSKGFDCVEAVGLREDTE
jgi:hypothetical protein